MTDVKQLIKEKNSEMYAIARGSMSVTACAGYMHKPFDKLGVATRVSNNPNSKYYQIPVDEIIKKWEAKGLVSTRYGSMLDEYSGMVFNKENRNIANWKLDHNYDNDTRLQHLCTGFDQFYKVISEKTDYVYIAREEKIFIKSNKTDEWLNGRLDWLFYSPSLNKYIVFDCKSSGEIESTSKYEKMLGPMYDHDACNLNEYTIQIYMYKKGLSEIYNLTTPDNIDVFICQITDAENDLGTHYKIHKPGFEYDTKLLDNIIEFAYKKRAIEKEEL